MKSALGANTHTLIVGGAFAAALAAYTIIAIVVSAADASALRDVVYLLGGAVAGVAGTSALSK